MDDFLIRRLLKLFGCLNAALEESQSALFFGGKSGTIKVSVEDGTVNLITVVVNGGTTPGQLGTLEYGGASFPVVRYKDGNKEQTCLAAKIKDGVYTPVLSQEHVLSIIGCGYKLAADGMLGGDIVEYGQKMHRLFDGVKVLWGEHADRVWALHLPKYAHNAKLAAATLSCLRHGITAPKSPTDARTKGAVFGFLTKNEWHGVTVLLEALTQ